MAMIFLIIKQFDWLKILIRFGTANQSVLFHARYSKVWILLRVVDRRRALERYFLFAFQTLFFQNFIVFFEKWILQKLDYNYELRIPFLSKLYTLLFKIGLFVRNWIFLYSKLHCSRMDFPKSDEGYEIYF